MMKSDLLISEQVPARLRYLTGMEKFLQQPVVIIRYIIHMRDGQSRTLRNGGMQSAGQQRKPYRRQISLQMRLQESGSMVRAGLQSQLTERETCWPIHQSGWIREHSLFVTD